MPSNRANKLLEKARNSTANWTRTDIDKLYDAFGFTIDHRASHDIVYHKEYPELRSTLPRHRMLNPVYVKQAVKLIEKLMEKGDDT